MGSEEQLLADPLGPSHLCCLVGLDGCGQNSCLNRGTNIALRCKIFPWFLKLLNSGSINEWYSLFVLFFSALFEVKYLALTKNLLQQNLKGLPRKKL